jgi:GH15 family glucan-1,4-alpha-glucosidase
MTASSSAAAALKIEDYGAIGDLRTVALIGRDGSIAWCCLPVLDRPSTFASLLDEQRGGRFRVAPVNVARGEQSYIEGSNVLQTKFALANGGVTVTDFMPVTRRGAKLRPASGEIHRLIEVEGEDCELDIEWSPRFDYARGRTGIAALDGGYVATGATQRATLVGIPSQAEISIDENKTTATLRARVSLRRGDSFALVMRHDSDELDASVATTKRRLRSTIDAWRHWCGQGTDPVWAGKHATLVQRSMLALKLLCNADTGGIAAAATTSLPEAIGGERNWDYRYVWLRDAGMTVESLLGAGHVDEVHAFLQFIERAARRPNRRGPWLQLVFGLHGETELPEVKLEHLAGYRDSRPVRIGNAIAEHRGHDIYEQVLGAALEYLALGYELAPRVMRFLARVADIACEEWRKPDHGIWELPDGPRHYVHSKWTTSTALDHAVRLAQRYGLQGDVERWARERDAARAQVLEKGVDPQTGVFRIAYDIDELDSANILMPVLGFLPADDPRVVATLDATMRDLVVDDLCYRYRLDDGLRGEEGCFVACTFWVIEALVMAGDLDRARKLFDQAASRCSPLGLWSEQIDLETGLHLGNVPQAFSHVAFHDAALRLAAAEGRRVPVDPDPAGIGAPARGAARKKSTHARKERTHETADRTHPLGHRGRLHPGLEQRTGTGTRKP